MKSKKLFIVQMLLLSFLFANGGIGGNNKGPASANIKLNIVKGRPKDNSKPSGEVIAYLYPNYISIWFEYPEGMAKVSLSEYGDRYIYRGFSHSSSDIIVNYTVTQTPVIPTRILVETAEGNAYEGWITESVFNDTVD